MSDQQPGDPGQPLPPTGQPPVQPLPPTGQPPVWPPAQPPGQPTYQQPPVPPRAMGPGSAQGYPPNGDERTWAMLSHGSFFVLSLIGPLIIMLTKGNESPYVRRSAVEALNFHISIFLYAAVSAILMLVLIGIVTFIATMVFGFVVAILAIIAASKGEDYRYPLTIRMVS